MRQVTDSLFVVNQAELESVLLRVASAEFIGFVALTNADLYVNAKGDRKAGAKCPYKGVQKRQDVSRAITCFEYERSRNNENARLHAKAIEQAADAGDLTLVAALRAEGPAKHDLQPRKWGERIAKTPFIRHKGELYLETRLQKTGPAAANVQTTYFDECDKEIKKDDLANWIKPKKVQEGEPAEFWYREYRMDHIVEIRAMGVVYVVEELAKFSRTPIQAAA